MVRLGLHLALRTGREARTRLLVTVGAVGIGVALLLGVLAVYHGYLTTQHRACWSCTGAPAPDSPPVADPGPPSAAPADGAELWHYTDDFYRGHKVERLDVAALGAQAPVVPGLTRLPGPGEYVASPALAELLATVPHDQLGDRFPGTGAGLIGPAGLSGPDDLAIVVGYRPADLAQVPGTRRITAVQTAPKRRGDTTIYQFGFALGAISLLVPMLVLIGNATRLAATRREERYAAMRLVGAAPRQVRLVASVEAVLAALLGSVLGIGLFLALQQLAAQITITGDRFYPGYVTPTLAGYLAVLLGVPAAAAAAAVLSLRRVSISPLGVSRRTTPPPPRAWRVVPVIAGVLLFVLPLTLGDPKDPPAAPAALGLVLVMTGLLAAGTWLTMRAARLLARFAAGPSALLAARRMADNPKAAFRSVSGLVLAVFVGTLLACVVPAALAAQHTATDTALDNVLRLSLSGGPHAVLPDTGADLVHRLQAFPGVSVLPLYAAPDATDDGPTVRVGPDQPGGKRGGGAVADCARLADLGALGTCAPGVAAVRLDPGSLLDTDNLGALNKELPLVTADSPTFIGDLGTLRVGAALVKVSDAATLERVRTFLAVTYRDLTGTVDGAAPQTFGEVAQVRAALYLELRTVVLLVIGVTLVVAGCSLAIAVGASLVERKRPFTLLRFSGTATGVLRRVVLLESALPLVAATVVAAGLGFGMSVPVSNALTPPNTPVAVHLPGQPYYLTVGTGLVLCAAVILLTLPLLNRITVPDSARFE
jgi:hypothetical protein